MSEPAASSSPGPYDVSEAALKELYRDRDDDDDDIVRRLVQAEEQNGDNPEKRPAGKIEAVAPLVPTIGPLHAEREPIDSPGKSAKKTKRRGKIVYAVVGVAILIVFGWASYRPTPTPRITEAVKPPAAIAGVLRVADLAAGRKINPGETYAFDLPAGKVRIAVVAGQVALTSKSGESLRACSNQTFVVDAASNSANSAHPLVSACGREPSSLQAEIPPPPLPAAAPPVAISPSTLRADGD